MSLMFGMVKHAIISEDNVCFGGKNPLIFNLILVTVKCRFVRFLQVKFDVMLMLHLIFLVFGWKSN